VVPFIEECRFWGKDMMAGAEKIRTVDTCSLQATAAPKLSPYKKHSDRSSSKEPTTLPPQQPAFDCQQLVCGEDVTG
jgi:hypothetical protein